MSLGISIVVTFEASPVNSNVSSPTTTVYLSAVMFELVVSTKVLPSADNTFPFSEAKDTVTAPFLTVTAVSAVAAFPSVISTFLAPICLIVEAAVNTFTVVFAVVVFAPVLIEALITASPSATPVTTPFASTVATAASLEADVIVALLGTAVA